MERESSIKYLENVYPYYYTTQRRPVRKMKLRAHALRLLLAILGLIVSFKIASAATTDDCRRDLLLTDLTAEEFALVPYSHNILGRIQDLKSVGLRDLAKRDLQAARTMNEAKMKKFTELSSKLRQAGKIADANLLDHQASLSQAAINTIDNVLNDKTKPD